MLTDVMLGSFMGSWTIWIEKGVIPAKNSVTIPSSTIPDII